MGVKIASFRVWRPLVLRGLHRDMTPEWWGDFCVGFTCRCGNKNLVLDDEEPTACDQCGREFRLLHRIEVRDPPT